MVFNSTRETFNFVKMLNLVDQKYFSPEQGLEPWTVRLKA